MSDYKQAIASLFDAVAVPYEHAAFFTYFGRKLVTQLQLTSEMRVLDVAAGRGALLFPAAEAVSYVAGIDISPEMVAQTNAEIQARGLTNAEMQVMDAEKLEFADESFEGVMCGYALFFFDPPDQALSEMRRVLKPNGQLALMTWGKFDERWKWLGELVKSYMPPNFEYPRLWRAPGLLNKPHEVEALVKKVGFREVQILTETYETFYPNEEAWWAFYREFAGWQPMAILSEADLARFKAEAFAKVAHLKLADGTIPQRYTSHFTLAKK